MMAEDIRLATAAELTALAAEVYKKANSSDLSSEGYLKRRIVGTLPSVPVMYDFEDGLPRFTIPMINGDIKGVSEILEDESDNKYQSVCSTGAEGASTTIVSSSVVYSELDLSAVSSGSSEVVIEFDFKMQRNGRMRAAIGDLETLRKITGDTKYETDGIAADIFSNADNTFQICGSGGAHESFFGAWLHCRFEINVAAQSVKYSVTNREDASDTQMGTADFRGACDGITGIALYTWLADDTVCFDNIKILTAGEIDIDERAIYIVKKEDVCCFYIYMDGSPVLIGRSDLSVILNDLISRVGALESKEGGWL